jgi:hypothetical protein
MTREEFMIAINNDGICRSAFSLEDNGQDECYILAQNNGDWDVHYSERGLVTQQRFFRTEADALDHLFTLLKSDPLTRLVI